MKTRQSTSVVPVNVSEEDRAEWVEGYRDEVILRAMETWKPGEIYLLSYDVEDHGHAISVSVKYRRVELDDITLGPASKPPA